MTTSDQLPFAQPHPLEPPPDLCALQATAAIHRIRTQVGDEAWLVTGSSEVRRLMDAELLGRSHRDPVNAPRSRTSAIFGGPVGEFETEIADHAQMRKLLQRRISPKHMRPLEPKVEALCAELLDDMERLGPPADSWRTWRSHCRSW